MLDRIRKAVSFAAEHGVTVAFSASTRRARQPDFFEQAYAAAVEAGAKEWPWWTRSASPPRKLRRPRRSRRRPPRPNVPVHFHGHNDFGLATASAVAAAKAGRRWIQRTINGMGEPPGTRTCRGRARARGALRIETGLRLDRAREVSARVRELSGYELEPWKPLVGDTLFRRESGAVASQFHDPPSIEPYSSELVGAERAIVLGKKSGIDSIRIKAAELGLDLCEDDERDLRSPVKTRGAEKRGLVTDEEFVELARR